MRPTMARDGAPPDVILKGGSPDVADMPVWRADGCFVSEWELNFAERKALMDGARVLLWVQGGTQPPIALEVEGVSYPDSWQLEATDD